MEPFLILVSVLRLVSFQRLIFISESSLSTGPGSGLMFKIRTGPITHQSPVTNCPAFTGLSKVHVMPYWLTSVRKAKLSSVEKAALLKERKTIEEKRRRDRRILFIITATMFGY